MTASPETVRVPMALRGVDQLGFVVADIEASMRYWVEVLGVGPWYHRPRSASKHLAYRGVDTSAVTSSAQAQAGGVQIELIQLLDDEPSAYRDMLPNGLDSLHHLGYYVEDYREALQDRLDEGLELVQVGDAGPTINYCYLADPRRPGPLVELIEIPALRSFFDELVDASRDWDGTDPIRIHVPRF